MMRKILLALCIALAGGSAAAKDGTNWKSISQMGADMVGAATQGVFKTVSETSKSLFAPNAPCRLYSKITTRPTPWWNA